jgi:predicted amidohydrolase YtcJ
MLLRNARIGTARFDVRIENGVIAELGQLAGEGIDLDGRWLSPGLWDNHVHFGQWAMHSRRLDLSAATSAREVAGLVEESIGTDLLVGGGFRDGLWTDAPSVELLDAVSDDVPVVLVSADLHAVWLNSAALSRYGHADHPTGLLREDDAFEVTREVGSVPDELLDDWARDAAAHAAARGVVGIVDLEMRWNLGDWQRRIAAGHDSLRVQFGIYQQHLDRAIEEGLRTGKTIGELLTVGGFKVLTDGSLNTRTAYCYDEYPGLEGKENPRGMLTLPPQQLVPLMRRAANAGIEPDVHAIGDHANTLVLDAFETIGSGGRLEHAQLLAESDFPRFARLGVVASVQPEHAMDDRDVADHYWAGRTGRAFALRSLLDAGAELSFGSDAPVAPLDPWVTMAAAVGRSRDGREPWHPEQRISNAEALTASPRSTIEAGAIADLVVTEIDPLATGHEQLRTMPVAATLLAGRFTYKNL